LKKSDLNRIWAENMTRILLINPHESEQSGFTNPPLGLLYIAGTLLKHGFDVQILDCCIEGEGAILKVVEGVRPDIVGITCLTPARKKSLEVAKTVKNYDSSIKVVMGGVHPTIMHKQLMENYPFLDIVVIGEGEITFLEIAQGKEISQINGITYREGNKVIKTTQRKYVENLDEIPFPAWHLVDLKKYPVLGKGIYNGINIAAEPRISVVFSRGCKGHCDFCSSWWVWRGWRHRSPKNMADELELLVKNHGMRHFNFADDALTIDMNATIELCDEIIRRKLKIAFLITTRTDCINEELLRKLKQAGCYQVAYGVETGSPILLSKMGKENDVETAKKAITLTKKAGMKAIALMIVGNVGETHETIRESIDFLRKTDPNEIGCIGGLLVFPGTKLYNDCKAKGFIDDDFWLRDEPYKVYTLEHSLDELKKMQHKVTVYSFKVQLRQAKPIVSVAIRHPIRSAIKAFKRIHKKPNVK
jgi:anaerobic magnesium-protoporphyrin IX monomethyl ester cyclase